LEKYLTDLIRTLLISPSIDLQVKDDFGRSYWRRMSNNVFFASPNVVQQHDLCVIQTGKVFCSRKKFRLVMTRGYASRYVFLCVTMDNRVRVLVSSASIPKK